MCGFNRQKPQMIIYAKLQSSRVRHQYGIFGGKSQTSFLAIRHSGRERRRTAVFAGYQNYGYMHEGSINLYTFLCRPLQNNNANRSNSMFFGEPKQRHVIFRIFHLELNAGVSLLV